MLILNGSRMNKKIRENRIETRVEGIKHTGGGWYLLPTGEKVQGKEKAERRWRDELDRS